MLERFIFFSMAYILGLGHVYKNTNKHYAFEKIKRCSAVHKITRIKVTLVYHMPVIGPKIKVFLNNFNSQKPILSLKCCINVYHFEVKLKTGNSLGHNEENIMFFIRVFKLC